MRDLVIIGGGPAGLAAALAAREAGVQDILVLERDKALGGILNQCIHNGFGLHYFKEELTGPEYAERFIRRLCAAGIEYKLETMVLTLDKDKSLSYMNEAEGMVSLSAQAVILAMGCRERARGALNIPGTRPAGVYSAGTIQRLMNLEGLRPGQRAVVLGSGDIGLIMARRLSLEGAEVSVVAELMPYSGGLKRNIVQCLEDYHIPLKLSHTVVEVHGEERVEGVTIAQVDERRQVIAGTESYYPCDTLLLSCGLIPENELSEKAGVVIDERSSGALVDEGLQTSVPGIFACGNVLHVHDLVDYVSDESAHAGRCAAAYLQRVKTRVALGQASEASVRVETGRGVRYTVPQILHPARMQERHLLRFRVDQIYKNQYLSLYIDGERVLHRKKLMMAPGEMEELALDSSLWPGRAAAHVRLCVEES